MKSRKVTAVFLLIALLISACGLSETFLPDGEYTADGFTWSGGSGKLKSITCDVIRIREGLSYGQITLSSDKYSYIKVDNVQYDCTHTENGSSAEIPVKLNGTTTILACTLAMSTPHEVEYKLRVELNAARDDSDTGITVANTRFELIDSDAFIRLYQSENADLIESDDSYYYLTNDPDNIPEGMEDEANVIIRPVSNVYLASDDAVDFVLETGTEGFTMVAEADPENSNLTERISDGSVTVVGKPESADYKTLLMNSCDLAVISETDATDEAVENLTMLGIPVYIDRDSACREEAMSLIFETEAK